MFLAQAVKCGPMQGFMLAPCHLNEKTMGHPKKLKTPKMKKKRDIYCNQTVHFNLRGFALVFRNFE